MKTDKLKLTTALDWTNRRLKEHPHLERLKIVEETAIKFDLGPLDEEWLIHQLTRRNSFSLLSLNSDHNMSKKVVIKWLNKPAAQAG